VLDLDGLLWGGVIGEDGLNGIVLGGTPAGEAFVAFQHYALGLRRRGIPLAVCSKNNPADARQPFMEHPEMVLKLEDIAVFAANWNNKEDNLREIAATLNLGLESLVFLDDNPMERARVRRALPDVEVPELPAEPALYVRALDELLLFEALDLTDEDRQRAAAYRQNAERQELHASSGNLADFLANLEMSVELQPFDAANLPRIVQLINKTNQFNLTTVRMTEAEVNALVGRPDCYLQAMRLRDRFGDNGLTGVLIGIEENDTLRIHNWLISCRVLGRRVEEVMLSAAIRHSRERGMRWVRGEFRPTAKNAQVRDVYDRMGFELLEERSDGARFYRWDAQGELPAHECFRVDDRTVVVLAERNHG
jgi:FkbH-like protein